MADNETVNVKLPSGETINAIVPQGWSDAQVGAMLRVKHPEFFGAAAQAQAQNAAQGQKIQALNAQPTQMEQDQSKAANQGFLGSLGESALGGDMGSNVQSLGDVAHSGAKNIRETIHLLATNPGAVASAAGDLVKAPLKAVADASSSPIAQLFPEVAAATALKSILQPAGKKVAGQLVQGNFRGAAGTALGTALPFAASGGANVAADVGENAERLASKGVNIAGQDIPVALADLQGKGGARAVQSVLEGTPMGAPIQQTRAAQLAGAKGALRNVAQGASGAVGPMPEGVADSFGTSAEAVRAQAKPIYEQIENATRGKDVDVTGVQEAARKELAKIQDAEMFAPNGAASNVRRALERASTAGVATPEIREAMAIADGTSKNYFKKPLQQLTPGERDSLFKILPQDVVDKVQGSEAQGPFQAVQDARSAIRSALRSTTDRADRRLLMQINDNMTDSLHSALEPMGLSGQLKAADAMTSKAYALDEVEKAIGGATHGTPESVQRTMPAPAAGKAEVTPQTIDGKSLVEKLNDLDSEGVLKRAFTPEHAQALRQIADILSKGQASAGGGMGSSRTVWRGLAAAAPAVSGGLGMIGGPKLAASAFGGMFGVGRLVSKALATPAGSKALLQYLRAPQGSAQASFWAARAAQMAQSPK